MIRDLRHAFAKFDLTEMEDSEQFSSNQSSPRLEQQSGGDSNDYSDESFFRIHQEDVCGVRGRTQSFNIETKALEFELNTNSDFNQDLTNESIDLSEGESENQHSNE